MWTSTSKVLTICPLKCRNLWSRMASDAHERLVKTSSNLLTPSNVDVRHHMQGGLLNWGAEMVQPGRHFNCLDAATGTEWLFFCDWVLWQLLCCVWCGSCVHWLMATPQHEVSELSIQQLSAKFPCIRTWAQLSPQLSPRLSAKRQLLISAPRKWWKSQKKRVNWKKTCVNMQNSRTVLSMSPL